jgi:hypothetical protein
MSRDATFSCEQIRCIQLLHRNVPPLTDAAHKLSAATKHRQPILNAIAIAIPLSLRGLSNLLNLDALAIGPWRSPRNRLLLDTPIHGIRANDVV